MSLDDFNWLCSVWLSLSKSQYKVVKFYTVHFCDLKDLQFWKTKDFSYPYLSHPAISIRKSIRDTKTGPESNPEANCCDPEQRLKNRGKSGGKYL